MEEKSMLERLISPFLELPKGILRMVIVAGLIIPILYGMNSANDFGDKFGNFIIALILYWGMFRVILWISSNPQVKKNKTCIYLIFR